MSDVLIVFWSKDPLNKLPMPGFFLAHVWCTQNFPCKWTVALFDGFPTDLFFTFWHPLRFWVCTHLSICFAVIVYPTYLSQSTPSSLKPVQYSMSLKLISIIFTVCQRIQPMSIYTGTCSIVDLNAFNVSLVFYLNLTLSINFRFVIWFRRHTLHKL